MTIGTGKVRIVSGLPYCPGLTGPLTHHGSLLHARCSGRTVAGTRSPGYIDEMTLSAREMSPFGSRKDPLWRGAGGPEMAQKHCFWCPAYPCFRPRTGISLKSRFFTSVHGQ